MDKPKSILHDILKLIALVGIVTSPLTYRIYKDSTDQTIPISQSQYQPARGEISSTPVEQPEPTQFTFLKWTTYCNTRCKTFTYAEYESYPDAPPSIIVLEINAEDRLLVRVLDTETQHRKFYTNTLPVELRIGTDNYVASQNFFINRNDALLVFSPSFSTRLQAIDDSHLGAAMSEEILENFNSGNRLRLAFNNMVLAGKGNIYFSLSGFQNAYGNRNIDFGPPEDGSFNAISTIRNILNENASEVQSEFINSVENPQGGGVFVYFFSRETTSVPRLYLWFVKDSKAIALNGPSKEETPDLPFPIEAGFEVWANTGLDASSVVSIGVELANR